MTTTTQTATLVDVHKPNDNADTPKQKARLQNDCKQRLLGHQCYSVDACKVTLSSTISTGLTPSRVGLLNQTQVGIYQINGGANFVAFVRFAMLKRRCTDSQSTTAWYFTRLYNGPRYIPYIKRCYWIDNIFSIFIHYHF